MRIGSVLGLAIILFALSSLAGAQPGGAEADEAAAASPSPSPDPLVEKLTAYFQAGAPRDQARLLREISELPKVSIDKVAAALPTLPLWEKHEPGVVTLTVPMPRIQARKVEEVSVALAVPEGYDPARAHPLVLVLLDDATQVGPAIQEMQRIEGEVSSEDRPASQSDAPPLLVAAVVNLRGVWLSSPPETAGDPVRVLAAIKHRVHVDTNRVYLYGEGLAAHAACVLAALQPDHFAGLISVGGTLALQLPAEVVAGMFLPNLRTVQSLLVFPHEPAEGSVATWNRYLAAAAEQFGTTLQAEEIPAPSPAAAVPTETNDGSATLPGANSDAPPSPGAEVSPRLNPPVEHVRELLAATRPVAPMQLSFWFRYPEQGRISWLVQRRFDGDPWTAQQLLVAPAPTETVAEAAVSLLKEKLAFLGGEVKGQEIRVSAQRCARIELRLPMGLVNFDEPITVYLEGTKRFEGKVTPRLATLLSIAREDWEFQRVYPVRLRLSPKGRAVEE